MALQIRQRFQDFDQAGILICARDGPTHATLFFHRVPLRDPWLLVGPSQLSAVSSGGHPIRMLDRRFRLLPERTSTSDSATHIHRRTTAFPACLFSAPSKNG